MASSHEPQQTQQHRGGAAVGCCHTSQEENHIQGHLDTEGHLVGTPRFGIQLQTLLYFNNDKLQHCTGKLRVSIVGLLSSLLANYDCLISL